MTFIEIETSKEISGLFSNMRHDECFIRLAVGTKGTAKLARGKADEFKVYFPCLEVMGFDYICLDRDELLLPPGKDCNHDEL